MYVRANFRIRGHFLTEGSIPCVVNGYSLDCSLNRSSCGVRKTRNSSLPREPARFTGRVSARCVSTKRKFERISTTTRRLWRRANWESSCIHVSFSSTLGKNLNFQPLQKLNFSRVFFARDCRERTQLCKLKTSRVEYNFLLYANLCAN